MFDRRKDQLAQRGRTFTIFSKKDGFIFKDTSLIIDQSGRHILLFVEGFDVYNETAGCGVEFKDIRGYIFDPFGQVFRIQRTSFTFLQYLIVDRFK